MSIEAMTIVLHHSQATGAEKLVLLGVANHEGDGGAFPALATLAKYANITERAARAAVARLVEAGELEVAVKKGGKVDSDPRYRTNRYHVLVRCPADCDRSMNHRPEGMQTSGLGDSDRMQTTVRPDANDHPDRMQTSGKPVLEPTPNHSAGESDAKLRFNAVWEALKAEIGDVVTGNERGKRAKVARQLVAAGADGADVIARCAAYRRKWPRIDLTDMALCSHWSSLTPTSQTLRPQRAPIAGAGPVGSFDRDDL